MKLSEFRELTKDMPGNVVIVTPTYLDCYTEVDVSVSKTLMDMSMDETYKNAYQDLGINMPESEYFPTIIVYARQDKAR